MEIIAIKITTHGDLIRLIGEVRKGNIIIASFSAFKNRNIRREVVRRVLEAGQKLKLNILGVGSEYLIVAPEHVKIKMNSNAVC